MALKSNMMNCNLFGLLFCVLLSVPLIVTGSKVVGLTEKNFKLELKKYPLALVKFYAPWCGHCKALAPEYIKAADELASSKYSILLAEVDCTEEKSLCEQYGVSGYPTLKTFRHGDLDSDYAGGRSSNEIVSYMSRRAAPSSIEVSSMDEIENQRHFELPTIVAYFKNTEDSFKAEYIKLASALLDNTMFMHTHTNIFGVDVERMIKLYIPKKLNSPLEKFVFEYTGKLKSDDLKKWIKDIGLGVFGHRTYKTEFFYPESDILIIYHNISFTDDPAGIKYFRNRVLKNLQDADLADMKVAYSDSNEYMRELSELGHDGALPLAAIRSRSGQKYKMDSFSFAGLSEFLENYKAGTLKAYLMSEPIPADDSGAVKTVVALNFNEVVNDPSKDVLIVFHAPWCGHCKNLMPKFTEAAEKMKAEPGVIFAKMDATANDVPKPYQVQGFPTIYFVPKSDKKNPKLYNSGREVKDLVEYVAKHSTDELVGFDRSGSLKKSEL